MERERNTRLGEKILASDDVQRLVIFLRLEIKEGDMHRKFFAIFSIFLPLRERLETLF